MKIQSYLRLFYFFIFVIMTFSPLFYFTFVSYLFSLIFFSSFSFFKKLSNKNTKVKKIKNFFENENFKRTVT